MVSVEEIKTDEQQTGVIDQEESTEEKDLGALIEETLDRRVSTGWSR